MKFFTIIGLAAMITFSTEGFVNVTTNRIAAIAATVHAYDHGIKRLATEMECSANLLYRAAVVGESNCDLGFAKVERLIEVTRDFAIIDFITNRFGFYKVRPPRVAVNRMNESDALSHLQTVSLAALQTLREFFFTPSVKNRRAADRALTECLATVESIRKRVRGKNFNQLELF